MDVQMISWPQGASTKREEKSNRWQKWSNTKPTARSSAMKVYNQLEEGKEYTNRELAEMYLPLKQREHGEILKKYNLSATMHYALKDIYPVVVSRLMLHGLLERVRKGVYVKISM